LNTSNVTRRHRGPKRKLRAGYLTERRHYIFDVQAPSLPPVPNFISVAPSIAELARGQKSCIQSITH